jgi:hypothetical protein
MIWKPKNIPTYSTKTNQWSETHFETRSEFSKYIDSLWRLPGEYNLKNTHLWRQPALKFQKEGKYTNYDSKTDEAKAFWAFEKKKIGQGIIIDDRYIPGEYYFYLNYCPIIDKIKGKNDFPELWDSDYHFYLYCLRAQLRDLNAGVIKARQKGFSLKIVSRLIRNLWFVPNSVNKMLGYEEDFVNDRGSWRFASMYRDFLNTHTPWYRDFEPDESLNWEQKKTIIEGTYETKKKQKGLRSKLVAATTKKNPAKAVGGGITELFHEEAGIAPNMHKVLEFAEAATKMGGVTTGFMIVSGAVGELKDAKPLEDISFEPLKYGFLGVEDCFSEVKSDNLTALFVPDFWNYIANDVEKGLVKCYDEDGNSDIELAKKYLLLEEKRHQGKDSYILWKSQHPWTLQDAFNIREENIFPVRVIKEHQTQLRATYAPLCIELEEDDLSKQITHKISYNKPITDLKVDPNKDNRGVIEIDEMPIDNPPYGLYYAGIDPIRPVNTVTSKSLMSVCIFKASHMKNGKLITDYPVARYTGRYPTWEETYHVCMRLCRFYNARVAVENNVTGFQEWAIRNNYAHYFMHRREIYIINELMPNSTIRDEIGIRMEGQFKEKALEFAVSYFDEILSSSVVERNKEDLPEIFTSEDEYDNEKSKELKFVYGVSRVRDVMLLEETLRFSKKLNTDRLVAFMCALIAARSNTNRNLIISETVHDPFKPNVPKDNRVSIPSPLQAKRMQSSQKVQSPFIKRR